jgi:integrase
MLTSIPGSMAARASSPGTQNRSGKTEAIDLALTRTTSSEDMEGLSRQQQHPDGIWRAADPWRVKAGLPAMVHVHDLRHTGNTLTGEAGAPLAKDSCPLPGHLGHSGVAICFVSLG